MKIKEIILESADSINTHLILLGFNLAELEETSNYCVAKFRIDPSLKISLIAVLNTINQKCLAIYSNQDLWDGHSNDPEVAVIYDRIVALFNNNSDLLENL